MTTLQALAPTAPPAPTPTGRRIRPRDVALFLTLAYALSWWPWPLSALSTRPDTAVQIPIGPSLAALTLLVVQRSRDDIRHLLRSTIDIRIGRLWWALGVPVALAATALATAVHLGAPAPSARELLLATAAAVAALPVTVILAGPLGEELGWRGFLLPVLLRRYTPFIATIAVAAAWITFHLPLIVTKPGQYGPGWALTLLGVALVMTRLHMASSGNLALAIAFHAAVNTATGIAVQSLPQTHRPTVWAVTALLWLSTALALELRARARRPRNPSVSR